MTDLAVEAKKAAVPSDIPTKAPVDLSLEESKKLRSELKKAVPDERVIAELLGRSTRLDLARAEISAAGAAALTSALRENKTLTALNLSDNKLDTASVKELVGVVTEHKRIEWLGLRGCGIDDVGVSALVPLFKKKPRMVLDLSNNNITAAELKGVAFEGGLHIIPNFSYNPVGDEGAELIARWTVASDLAELTLNGTNLSAEGIKAIADISSTSSVTVINLRSNLLKVEGIKAVAYLLARVPLVSIDISRTGIGVPACWVLGDFFAKGVAPALRILYLEDNQIGDDGTTALMQGLGKGEIKIEVLDLANNQIGDRGTKAVAELLITSPHIGRIFLNKNRITDQSAVLLLAAIKRCPTIIEIDLTDNPIVSITLLEQIAAALARNLRRKEKAQVQTAPPAPLGIFRALASLPLLEIKNLQYLLNSCVLIEGVREVGFILKFSPRLLETGKLDLRKAVIQMLKDHPAVSVGEVEPNNTLKVKNITLEDFQKILNPQLEEKKPTTTIKRSF